MKTAINLQDPCFRGVGPWIATIVTKYARKWRLDFEELLQESLIFCVTKVFPKYDESQGSLTTLVHKCLSRMLHRHCVYATIRQPLRLDSGYMQAVMPGDFCTEIDPAILAEAMHMRRDAVRAFLRTKLKDLGWSQRKIAQQIEDLRDTKPTTRRTFYQAVDA